MNKQSLIELFDAGEPAHKINRTLGQMDDEEASRLLWSLFRDDEVPFNATTSTFWMRLATAPEGTFEAADFLRFLEVHGHWLASPEHDTSLDEEMRYSGKSNGNLPFWHRDLDEMLERSLDDDGELVVQGWSSVEGLVGRGLGYALARRGLVPSTDLDDETVTEVARDIVFNNVQRDALEDAREVFAEDARFGRILAELGACRGAQTSYELWWGLAQEHATPAQRAQWLLNLSATRPMEAVTDFIDEHFTDEDYEALLDLIPSAAENPGDANHPAFRGIGATTAVFWIARESEGREVSDAELFAIKTLFRPKGNSNDELRAVLGRLPAATREEIVVGLIEAGRHGWWMMVPEALTPAVVQEVVAKAVEAKGADYSRKSFVRNLEGLDDSELERLAGTVDEAANPPEYLHEMLAEYRPEPALQAEVDVDYLDAERARELAAELCELYSGPRTRQKQYDAPTIVVDPAFSFFGDAKFAAAALKNRGAVARVLSLGADNSEMLDRERQESIELQLDNVDYVVAEVDSLVARRAGSRGIAVVGAEVFRDLLGAPLVDLKERLIRAVALAREQVEVVHLHIGEPVSDEAIRKVEADVLGFSMPDELEAFYKQINGFSVYVSSSWDADKTTTDPTIPLEPEHEEFVPWHKFATKMDPSLVYPDAYERAELETDNLEHFIGAACLLPLEEVFLETNWQEILYSEPNVSLFDAFDDYYSTALEVDRERQQVGALLYEDHGAAARTRVPTGVEAYVEGLIAGVFTDRVFLTEEDGRATGVRHRINVDAQS